MIRFLFGAPSFGYVQFRDEFHARIETRVLHACCTCLGLALSVMPFAFLFARPCVWLACVWVAVYALNTVQHPLIERNRPASTLGPRSFLRAALFNFRMTWDTVKSEPDAGMFAFILFLFVLAAVSWRILP
jgi:Protein of unknown function (DUF962).